MKLNKDNVYKFGETDSILGFAENNFSIYVKSMIYVDEISYNQDYYLIGRSNKQSGIYFQKLENDSIMVTFSYWFVSVYRSDEFECKSISYILPEEWKNVSNEYMMICNSESKQIYCYVNNERKGVIFYTDFVKENYSVSPIWLGYGDNKSIGSFEIESLILMNKNIEIGDIYFIKDNFNDYIEHTIDNVPFINDTLIHKDNILFISDFKNNVSNYILNGDIPQLFQY